jgi:hypothetical protein
LEVGLRHSTFGGSGNPRARSDVRKCSFATLESSSAPNFSTNSWLLCLLPPRRREELHTVLAFEFLQSGHELVPGRIEAAATAGPLLRGASGQVRFPAHRHHRPFEGLFAAGELIANGALGQRVHPVALAHKVFNGACVPPGEQGVDALNFE